ncbi:MAG: glycosyltransferase family 2 protein, partial [Pseudomonadota bacterium]
PTATLALLIALAGAVYMANMALKIAAVAYGLRAQRDHEAAAKTDRVSRSGTIPLHPDPTITILVPLFEEREIAGALLDRISRLDYPRDRLDVIFILEACDTTTQEALAAGTLPHWARAIIVPDGQPRTKPRALNYALPFARGTIIGIYDAEDCPEPDQLLAVTRRFSAAPPELACLQGQLDYYNATHNWISRCFTLEYASWFRLLLPGVARLGLIVPLGGTTLFLRKKALLDVGGWDAHNVTEDAELGLRLARAGYRTDLIATTTFEEANSELWPWIKQRSRWLKGYAITWATAMRQPRRLLRELGWKRFLGLQVQLGGTVIGFLTAPLIWSLAAIPLGLWHPLAPWIGPVAGQVLVWGFAASLAVTLSVAWLACRAPHLRALRWWLPALTLYFPLASAAMVVALSDLLWRPFHWVKTAHGHYSARNVDKSAVSAEASSLSRTSKARDRCETSSE